MATQNGNSQHKRAASGRRVVVLAVPPVDEFDLVCPIQVFGAANRLAGKPVYNIQVVTNGKDAQVQGGGGVLSFVAESSYKALNENFDSLLLGLEAIQELQLWITDNLRKRLSAQVLADRVAMSVRNFERVFTREVGRTPSHYVLQARVEAVRHQLERTDRGLKQIAAVFGFGSADVMRRSFLRFVGGTPNQYRQSTRVSWEG